MYLNTEPLYSLEDRWLSNNGSDEPVDPMGVLEFRPQPKQERLLQACGLLEWFRGEGTIREPVAGVLGYGGAAYGGKTYGFLGLGAIAALAFPGVQISFFRRTYREMDGPGAAMFEANQVFGGIAKRRDEGRHWRFENGSDFYFRHCEHEEDVYQYQSQQMDILLVDESTHFTWFIIDYLLTRNRVSGKSGILKPFAVLGSNPGNIGHSWYMQLFDLDGKMGGHLQVKHLLNPNNRYSDVYFIPAYIADNTIGLERDPEYEKRLREREPDLAEALIEGNWNVFSGQAFREWDATRHTCPPFELPWNWPRWRAVDWGYADPAVCLWFAKDIDSGRIYCYREWYQGGLTDRQQATTIATYSPAEEGVSITFADPSMWVHKNLDGRVGSSADEYRAMGVPLYRADNNRINGKKKIHRLLANLPDGKPGLVFFDTCIHTIRTLPKLARSLANVEDIADGQDDHCYDCLRYSLSNVELFGAARKKPGAKQPNPWQSLGGVV